MIGRRWVVGTVAPDLNNAMFVAYSWNKCPAPHNLLSGIGAGGRNILVQWMDGVDPARQTHVPDEAMVLLRTSLAIAPVRQKGLLGFRSAIWVPRRVTEFNPEVVTLVEHPKAKSRDRMGVSREKRAAYVAAAFDASRLTASTAFVTVPGLGSCVVEQWVDGKSALQLIAEAVSNGQITFATQPPNRTLYYIPRNGRMSLRTP